eukprot:GFYU01011542.1.p1 GENE.GFYU01011542.1~~GFYU01011542.1.p1  ORF type:complete len:122 (-),score=15.93 GFYU01011542.1:198-563(-)
MPYCCVCVYQDGSVRLWSPYTEEDGSPDQYFMNAINSLPMKNRLEKITSDGILRWKMPVGWPYLPVVLTKMEKHGWSIHSSSAAGAVDPSDMTHIYLLHHPGNHKDSAMKHPAGTSFAQHR